eukprot:TRINITY_DN1252_c0_g2_i1.p1 TRINITY_DN1252_c0_g2~~TRINITY_DN1252_c0_g2_i1.p1  ORF type:complete len:580 (+),score=184.83 TRINITY_DN1252_c0_g2_i1:67-1740(+)
MKQTIAKIFLIAILIQNVFAFTTAAHEKRVLKGIDISEEAISGVWESSPFAAREISDMEISVNFALTQPKTQELDELFHAVSDPQNENYGQYLTREQLVEMMAVDEEVIGRVSMWLKTSGVNNINVMTTRDIINIRAPVSLIEDLLQVRFSAWVDRKTGNSVIRSLDAPSVPSFIADDIHVITQVNNFPLPRVPLVQKKTAPLGKEATNTPASLRALYKITDVGSQAVNVSQGCVEFEGQKYSAHDLEKFQEHFKLPQQTVRKNFHDAAGTGHVEANLDVQYIMGVAQGVATDMYLEQGLSFDMLKWADEVVATPGAPLVWSISYGEAMMTVSAATAQRVNSEIQKLGVIGVSVMIASGDTGVYSRTGGTDKFHPSYPAGLPSVTAVGATDLNSDGTEDTAVDWSGGGFTIDGYFPRSQVATYQDAAVKAYFASGVTLPPKDMYNANGVGIPDVSAQGVKFEVYYHDFKISVGGTSAACPTFAATISLLNTELNKAGKPPMGFLNPWIYQNGAAFNDIVKGTNNNKEKYGFTATKGWDPVTGMGTPNYPEMRKAANV